MLLAFILCFSTLPMTAFAQEADAVTEQAGPAAEQEEQQEDAEAAATPGEETPADKSTTAAAPGTEDSTAGEAPDKSVSDSNAGTQETVVDDEKKAAVRQVQALIDALPETVTEDNAESVSAQLEAIAEAMESLTEEQIAELDMEHLYAISEALNAPMTVVEGEHIHPVCGATCTDENGHSNVTWTATSTLNSDMDAGNYYLTADVTLDDTWRPKSGTALDLNGHSITVDADIAAITVSNGYSFTLTDCNSSGGVHYFTKNTEKNNLWEPVEMGGNITVTGGVITHSSGRNGSGIVMQAGSNNGTFNMYGGTICGNYSTMAGAGVRSTYGKIIMSGGAISGNVADKNSSGGGVYLNGNGGSFDMFGNAKITDNATNRFGGGVNVTGDGNGKASFTMSGNAQITGNMCFGSACGGAGVYVSGGEFTMNDNAAISDNHSLEDRGYGGGVFVSANTTFTMNDNATISGNSAYIESTSDYRKNYGGGVLVLGGTFNMNGGSISDNMAENGAGVYVGKNGSTPGTFTMNGGTITNNKAIKGNGGGVYVLSGFEIANDAQVLNNLRQDTSGQDTSNNVYLTTGKTFQINGKLTGGVHSIGVSAVDTPAEGSPVTIATAATGYTLTEEDADCFTSDADGIYPVLANNKMQLSTTAPHRHCLCGKEHHDVGNHTTDSQMTFTKLWMDDDGKLKIGDTELTATVTQDKGYFDQGQNVTCYELPAGNYYLGSSITLDYPIYIASHWGTAPASKDVKLCLNGKTITANGDFSAIVCSSVVSKTTFTLTDCQQTAGTITHAANKTGSGVLLYSNGNGTRFNMYGGSLTHNTAERGGGVNIVANGDGGIFNLYGGVISGNKADGAGGGVYMNGRNSTFTMYAGKITSNTAGKDGGGVSSASAKFIMNGGSITGNTAVTGGGVSVGCYSSTDFTMNGGKIKNNMASDNGGGVYMGGRLRSYTFTLNGTPDISGNTKAGVANNVYLSSGAVITVGNLDANTQIPVTLEKMPTKGFYVKFAEAGMGVELNDPIAHQFIIENDGSNGCDKKIIENEPNELWLYVTGDKLHQHAICGEFCDHEPNHSKELWTPLTYNADTQQLMYGSLPVPSAVKEIGAADDQGNPTKAYYTTYKLPAGNYYLADTIDMKGGSTTYKGNEVTSKGGVLEIETDVNLCLNGKRLVTSAPHVGVIVIQKAGTLTLSDCGTDGEIRSSCNAFAGVQIANDTSQAGTFTMYDGAIKYTATGVLMGSNSIFNMYGGTIANNETGVSVVSTSKLTVGGSADITGNDNENVSLNDKAMITIDSSLAYNARIGVTTEKDPTDENPIQIATGATGWVPYTEIFKPDGTNQGYVVTENDGKLYLNSHIHNWIYDLSADQQTIMATCNVTGCPNSKGGWVTINKPEHEVYGDGKSAEATLKRFNWQADAVTESNIKYEQAGKILSGAPTDAGTYWASITIGNKTAGVRYTINSKNVTKPTITVNGTYTYDGTEKKPSVVVKDGEKVISDSEYSVSYIDNINAGTATVTITDVAGGNYDVSGSTTFTIGKATITVTPEDDQKTIYGSADLPLRYSCSGAVNGEKPAFAGALSRIMGKDTGKYDITLGTLALADNSAGNFRADNYELKFADTPVQFTIVPKTLSAEDLEFITDSPITKTYDGTTACDTATVRIKSSAIAYDKDVLPTVKGTYAYNSANVTEANEVIFTSEASENQNYILPAGLKLGHAANITKADQAALTITSTSATYGTDLTLTVDGGSGNGALTYTVGNGTGAATISGSTLRPVRAGQVTVTVKKSGGDNYNDVTSSVTITINKGTYTGTVGKTVNIIKNRSTAQTGTLKAADFFLGKPVPDGAVISNTEGGVDSDVVAEMVLNKTAGEFSYTSAANITSTTDQTCTVTISSTNYRDITATLTFHPTDRATVTIDGLTYTDKTYDGKAMEPEGTLKVSGDKVPVSELEVKYEGTGNTAYNSTTAPRDAGTYQVTYKVGENNENYTGEVTYTFTISQKNVTKDMIGAIAAQEYTGSAITPELVVKDGGVALILGTDFDLKYDNNTNAGTATLTITGKGNYKGTADKTFTIERKDIAGAVIKLEQSELCYNGSTQTVKIESVTVGGKTLASGDYSIINGSDMFMSAKDSIPLTIEGRGNYTGTATTTWKITKIDPVLDNFVVTSDLSTAQTYDGTPKAVTVQTKDVIGMGAVKVYYEGTDGTTYTRSETAPTNAGSYKVILNVAEGTNYKAATDLTKDDWVFTIQPATLTVTPTAGQSKTYGDRDPVAFSYEVSGEKFNDKSVFTGTLGRAEGKNAGTYAITLGTLALKDGANFLAKNYKLVLDETTVNFTIDPKILQSTDLQPLGSTVTKVYDGTTKVNELNVVVDSDSMAAGDAEIKVTGTAVYNSANVADAKSVIFTPDAITTGNYRLAATEQLEVSGILSVAITPATITVTPDAGQTKIYGAKDPELTYTYSGEIPGEEPLFTGALGREAGENVGSYVINKETLALMDNSNGNFSAGNYTLEVSDTPVNFVINRATPEIKVEDKILVKNGVAVDISTWASFNNTDTDAKLVYTLVGAPAGISLTEDNLLKAENADTTAESFKIKVTADATTNFTAPEQKQFTVQVVEKADAGVKIDAPTSKTYGDADFTLQASTVAADNGTWSWTSSNESILKIVSGAETAAPVIHVVKADATGATLTATYISDAYYGTASVTIKVAPKTVTDAMIGEMENREYNGGAIMPTPEVKDGEAILTPGGDFEFDYSDNTNAGTATLTITGKGNYTGIAEKKFTIEPKNIESAIIVLGGLNRPYTGEEQTVEIVSVTLPDGDGVNLERDIDYTVKDNSNTATDAAKIVLTIEGKGNYTGTAEKTWEITKAAPELGNFDVTPDLSQKQIYNGNQQKVTAVHKNGVNGMGEVKVYYEGTSGTAYTRSETAPTNAGSYKVILTVAEGTNYTAAEIEAGTLTIEKTTFEVEDVTEFFEYTKTGAQTIDLAELVPGATNYALGTAAGDIGVLSEAITIDETAGLMKFALSALTKDNVDNKVTVPVTITSENYEDVTVNVIIYISPEYRIIDGANSSWTQNTDGTVVIRGNGEFSMFHAVKVDGKVIDPANYEAKEGSTIITLKAEYLKTLAAGSHTFEIVWTDGSAGTDFTVVVNTPSNNGNSSNDDSNHGSDNSGNNDSGNTAGAAANTAAATAQELDKVPATGDPFGIWLTLFAISLTGLAGMLARRKKQ